MSWALALALAFTRRAGETRMEPEALEAPRPGAPELEPGQPEPEQPEPEPDQPEAWAVSASAQIRPAKRVPPEDPEDGGRDVARSGGRARSPEAEAWPALHARGAVVELEEVWTPSRQQYLSKAGLWTLGAGFGAILLFGSCWWLMPDLDKEDLEKEALARRKPRSRRDRAWDGSKISAMVPSDLPTLPELAEFSPPATQDGLWEAFASSEDEPVEDEPGAHGSPVEAPAPRRALRSPKGELPPDLEPERHATVPARPPARSGPARPGTVPAVQSEPGGSSSSASRSTGISCASFHSASSESSPPSSAQETRRRQRSGSASPTSAWGTGWLFT